MNKIKVDRERKVPELKELNEKDLIEVLRKNEIDIYENEIALLDEMSLGLNLNELGDRQTMFVFNFLDNDMMNTLTNVKTKNNLLNSFIMTFENHEEISNSIWEARYEKIYDKNGEPYEIVKFPIKDFVMYRKWVSRASKYWNNNNLEKYVDNFRFLLEGNVDRAETLKDAIYKDSISDNVSERVLLDSRRQMVDILGLKKERVHNNLNIFTSGGGRDMANAIQEIGGRKIDVTSYLDNEDD